MPIFKSAFFIYSIKINFMRHIYDFDSYRTNEKNWPNGVDITKGKMHKLLNILMVRKY